MAKGPAQSKSPGAITPAFTQASPTAFARVGGNPASIKAMAGIERRATALKEKAINHAEKFRDRWTAKEAIRIWQRRLEQNAQYPAPPGEKRTVLPEEVLKMASRNVQARTMKRLGTINAIKTRMHNAIARNMDTPKLTRTFEDAARDEQPKRKQQMKQSP